MSGILKQRETLLAVLVIVLIGGVGLQEPVYIQSKSLGNLLVESAVLVMLALTQMFVIITRGIDLSVASTLALSGMIAALLNATVPGLPLAAIVAIAMGSGLLLGLLNGWLIGYLELPPIVVTLGTMSVYRGLVFVLSNGKWVSAHQMSPEFIGFPLETLLGVTHLVWIAAVVVVAMGYLARYTRYGRDLYAIGNEPSSARYVGIPTPKRLFWTYGLSGLVAGLCGYLWVARYAVAYTEVALGYELTVIAACVIGGVSIAGGSGSIAGAVLGSLFLAVINTALPILKVNPFWQSALTGAVILVAVLINGRGSKKTSRQILPMHLINPKAKRSAA